MVRPISVLISDIHYNLHTLPLADAAMRQAITKANSLNVPLIVAGDLHDTKANLRGECVNAMLETFEQCETTTFILRGNHDALNEKSKAHSLNFLNSASGNICIVDEPHYTGIGRLVPYHHDPAELRSYLKTIPKGSTLIMHQGLKGGSMGDYIQDHSAIDADDVKDFRVISGHYHTRQDIKTGRPQKGAVGLFSYIGNPYSLTWGEARDPEKGFQVLYSDGTLGFVSTNLRKHVIVEATVQDYQSKIVTAQADDLLWLKISGTVNDTISRKEVAEFLGRETFKLTFDVVRPEAKEVRTNQTQDAILDAILDRHENSDRLKSLWRGLCE